MVQALKIAVNYVQYMVEIRIRSTSERLKPRSAEIRPPMAPAFLH